jgi:general secretion pathway protein G
MRAKKGFTLVEILIVVVILGILAAIVIPQFSQASTEAKLNSLMSNLQSMRSQIELYKVQHNDNPPELTGIQADVTIIGSGQLTGKTDINGDPGTDFGPYLQRIPNNPFTGSNTVGGFNSGSDWEYNETTGQIRAGDAGNEGDTVKVNGVDVSITDL